MPDWSLLKGAAPPAADSVPITGASITVAMGMAMRLTLGCRDRRRVTAGLAPASHLGLTLLAGRYSWLKWSAALFTHHEL